MVAVMGNDLAKAFGRRLRDLREAKGWTQAELADRAGMLYQDISRLERGVRAPSWETLLKLAVALEARLDEFRTADPTGETPADGGEPDEAPRAGGTDPSPPPRPLGKRK